MPALPLARVALAVAAWCCGLAHAQDIRVERKGCERGVRVVARNAPAGDVILKLSQSLGFRLSLATRLDGVVNFDSVVPISEVVSAVFPLQNVIITHRNDPDCPGRSRITGVWMLARAQLPPPPHLPAIAAIPVTPEAREQDELYQRAHGMMPELNPPAAPATPATPKPQ